LAALCKQKLPRRLRSRNKFEQVWFRAIPLLCDYKLRCKRKVFFRSDPLIWTLQPLLTFRCRRDRLVKPAGVVRERIVDLSAAQNHDCKTAIPGSSSACYHVQNFQKEMRSGSSVSRCVIFVFRWSPFSCFLPPCHSSPTSTYLPCARRKLPPSTLSPSSPWDIAICSQRA
jgi:hypothetical protein